MGVRKIENKTAITVIRVWNQVTLKLPVRIEHKNGSPCFGDQLNSKNIAGRLPENSRNSFVKLRSQKDSKRNIWAFNKKNFLVFLLHFYEDPVNFIAASNSCSQITFNCSGTHSLDLISLI